MGEKTRKPDRDPGRDKPDDAVRDDEPRRPPARN